MATYIIGDVQGCFLELQLLLEKINYNPTYDRLGFVGDLVNRGPDSLGVLRFIKKLSNPLVVLGNHDFYLLAIGYNAIDYKGGHTLKFVLQAPDKIELLEWLRHQPLAIYISEQDSLLVHAGIPPQWILKDVLDYAHEVTRELQGPHFVDGLRDLEFHKSELRQWSRQIAGSERLRYIVNALTRIRFCSANGELDLTNKTAQSSKPGVFRPWYEWYQLPHQIIFGHWAALDGQVNHDRCIGLDTGCVWGRELTAFRLEDKQKFSVPAVKP